MTMYILNTKLVSCFQCINRVAERLEQSVGATPVEVSKLIKSKFVSMVEQHYLQRIKPPVTETALNDDECGGVVKMPVFGKFELPSTLNCK